ncbi:hypothetical protein K0U00_00610 [Paenibacillus sepulcri]|uniref:Uncharacterized protein n=1 Tax=Paenibacillus sepulcri TaxID=359917 RepID=A0ABS7BV65_9BACL|nr:hypothetical protein [Paenibacillus sepulcri]
MEHDFAKIRKDQHQHLMKLRLMLKVSDMSVKEQHLKIYRKEESDQLCLPGS